MKIYFYMFLLFTSIFAKNYNYEDYMSSYQKWRGPVIVDINTTKKILFTPPIVFLLIEKTLITKKGKSH